MVTVLEILEQVFSGRNSGVGLQIEDQITPGYLCAVQLVVIKNSVFMNNVLPTSWYGEVVCLCTVPYSVQIYGETIKQNSGVQILRTM